MPTNLQMAMFPPSSEWCPPGDLPNLTQAKTIAIDLETRDPNLKTKGPGWPTGNGNVVGYAIAVDGWQGYLPVAHFGGGNLDAKVIRPWLKQIFECPADKIMHNAQYDWGWLKREGFKVNGRVIDTMVIASLLDENRMSYSLNALAYDYLGKIKAEKGLIEAANEFGINPKGELWKLPALYVGEYAQTDAVLTLELWNAFKVAIQAEDLWNIVNLELDLLPCLLEMTWRGIRIDRPRLEETRHYLLEGEKEAHKQLKEITGLTLDIWSAKSLVKAFDNLNIRYPKTEQGNPSFHKDFLKNHPHELPQLVSKARKLNKLSGTFIDSIEEHSKFDGRIHAHINQTRSDRGGTVSGRISMSNPNLQQIPAHDPLIPAKVNIRSLFLPEEGDSWCSGDFAQQEPRILVHYAQVFGKNRRNPLKGAQEFVDAYNKDPGTDFHVLVAEMARISRDRAKTINLAMMYGMGQNKLAKELNIPLDEAKELIKNYHKRVPFVRGLQQGVMNRLNQADASGSLRSILGRKCRFHLWEPDDFSMAKALPFREAVQEYGSTTKLRRAFIYKALNRLIQASAADMTKKAMVNCYQQGIVPLLQIHDELALSISSSAEVQNFIKIMEEAVLLEVPNKCDVKLGRSWGEAA